MAKLDWKQITDSTSYQKKFGEAEVMYAKELKAFMAKDGVVEKAILVANVIGIY
jgi:hypothetical protein